MNHPLGISRNVVKERYALFTPDGFVASALPGWTCCVPYVLISRGLGANFAQLLIVLDENGSGKGSTAGTEFFAFVCEGACAVNGHALNEGGFIFLPPQTDYEFRAAAKNTRVLIFQKTYEPLAGGRAPEIFAGNENGVEA